MSSAIEDKNAFRKRYKDHYYYLDCKTGGRSYLFVYIDESRDFIERNSEKLYRTFGGEFFRGRGLILMSGDRPR